MAREGSTPPGDRPVNYRRPPEATRFQKGQSGNPKGRPKGAPKMSDIFVKEASRLISVKSGDKVRKITKREALVRRLIDMALQGDLPAARLALPHMFEADAQADASGSPQADTPPLSEAERAAMEILMDRLKEEDGDDG